MLSDVCTVQRAGYGEIVAFHLSLSAYRCTLNNEPHWHAAETAAEAAAAACHFGSLFKVRLYVDNYAISIDYNDRRGRVHSSATIRRLCLYHCKNCSNMTAECSCLLQDWNKTSKSIA